MNNILSSYRPIRRVFAAGLLALGAVGSAHAQEQFTYMTNWYAQAEHGGFYQAVATGIYKKLGLDVSIKMGGPQVNIMQIMAAGQTECVMGSSDLQMMQIRESGVPVVTVAAIFQKDPQVLISHPGVGNDTLADLKGKPILVGAGGRSSYWPFLRAKFGFTDEQVRPYTFNMAPFLADTKLSQQGFLSSEPYAIMKAGVNPVVHLIADAGFENYQTTINISRKMADEKKDLVQRFVSASLEGWAEYMKGGAATAAANALIKKDNPDMDDDKMAYALKVMNEKGIVRSGDALKLGVGAMTDARWKSFYETMAGAGVLPPGLDARKAYSLEFVNKGIGA